LRWGKVRECLNSWVLRWGCSFHFLWRFNLGSLKSVLCFLHRRLILLSLLRSIHSFVEIHEKFNVFICLVCMLRVCMLYQLILPIVSSITLRTCIGPIISIIKFRNQKILFICMSSFMIFTITDSGESFKAMDTLIGLLASMCSHVY